MNMKTLSNEEQRAVERFLLEILNDFRTQPNLAAYEYNVTTPDADLTEAAMAEAARRMLAKGWEVSRPNLGPAGIGLVVKRPKGPLV
jgi:hypothetical protein